MTGPCEPVFTVESSLTQDRFSLTLTTAWDDTVVIAYIAVIAEVASRFERLMPTNLIAWLRMACGFVNHTGALCSGCVPTGLPDTNLRAMSMVSAETECLQTLSGPRRCYQHLRGPDPQPCVLRTWAMSTLTCFAPHGEASLSPDPVDERLSPQRRLACCVFWCAAAQAIA